MLFAAVLSLYGSSTGFVAGALERSLHAHPAMPPDAEVPAAGVIVVLGAGSYRDPPEYEGSDTVGRLTLERLRYAASLHRRSGLPLLVTGGGTLPGTPAEAAAMALSLEDDFGIGVRFVEDRSRNTAENAANSARMLSEAGISRIVLVTHAVHMARAVRAFEGQGLEVVPAPTVIAGERPRGRRLLAPHRLRARPLRPRPARARRPALVPAALLAPLTRASPMSPPDSAVMKSHQPRHAALDNGKALGFTWWEDGGRRRRGVHRHSPPSRRVSGSRFDLFKRRDVWNILLP